MRILFTFISWMIIGCLPFCLLSVSAIGKESCMPIKFEAGTTSTVLHGMVPADNVVCFTLKTGSEQKVQLDISDGNNTVFSIDDITDAQKHFEFRTLNKTYKIFIGQLMRASSEQAYTLKVSAL